MPSKVLLQKNVRTGKFRFSLLSARGQVIVASEPYESKRCAHRPSDAHGSRNAGTL